MIPLTRDGKMTVKEFWEDIPHIHVFQKLWTSLYNQFVKPDELTFDIGAFEGQRTNALCKAGARVVAVEPLAHLRPELVQGLIWKFGEDPQVTIVPKAVSNHIGTESFVLNEKIPDMSSMSLQFMSESDHRKFYTVELCTKEEIATTTLDALIEEFGVPVFLKVDVEGYEHMVFEGLSHPVRAFAIEFHRNWLANNTACMVHMNSLGRYEYNYVFNNQTDFRSRFWVSREVLISHLKETLPTSGDWSWGDIYGRRVDAEWPLN